MPDSSSAALDEKPFGSRRLARTLALEADRVRLLAYADELDAQADALEEAAREAAKVTPPITQEQAQHAQQGRTRPVWAAESTVDGVSRI